jgi:hypothetical protein
MRKDLDTYSSDPRWGTLYTHNDRRECSDDDSIYVDSDVDGTRDADSDTDDKALIAPLGYALVAKPPTTSCFFTARPVLAFLTRGTCHPSSEQGASFLTKATPKVGVLVRHTLLYLSHLSI